MKASSRWVVSSKELATAPHAAPHSAKGNVINVDFFALPSELPAVVSDIDDFIASLEMDQETAGLLAEARVRVGKEFFGEKLTFAKLRLQKGLSQKQLADRIGTQQPQVARIESGRTDPQRSTIDKLMEALGVDYPTLSAALDGSKKNG